MKRLFIKTLILCVFIGILISFLIILPLPQNAYSLAIIDKHARLAHTQGRKLALAGGSNLAFGMDSAVIQEVMHLPVINLGGNAGFGLGRILEDLAPFLQAGDLLLIAPEYHHFSSDWNGDEAAFELIFDTGFIARHQYRLLRSRDYGLPKGFIPYLNTKIESFFARFRPSNPTAYSRYKFNEYGDYIGHLELEPVPIETRRPITAINQSFLAAFFRIVSRFHAQGITVLLSYPSYDASSFDASRDFIHELDAVFRQNQDMTVISTPEDYRFDREYFYDTAYHLNKTGRDIRTRRLAADLEAWREP